MSVDPQKFCLKWNDYRHSVTTAFEGLRQDEELVDMTLCCEGRKIKAHRMMMSACSPFFRDLLKENPCRHPVFFLRDVSYQDLWSAIEFVYKGEVNVSQANLASFLKTAEMLQLRGLTDDDKGTPGTPGSQPPASAASPRPASAESRRQTDGGAGWEAESAEPAPRPAKRPRTQHTAAPPPPPPPAAPAAALDPVAVKRETPPPPPPPPPPFAPMGDVGYGAEQEPDPGLRTILYHDQASGPPGMSVDPDGPAAGDPISLQLLEADQAIDVWRARPVSREEGRNTFACETCGREYSTRNALGKHRKVHLGETTCQACHKVFSSKWRLQYHFKTSNCPPG